MKHVQKISQIQGDHIVALLKTGLGDEASLQLSSDVIQAFLDAKLFSSEVQDEIDEFLDNAKNHNNNILK